MAPSGGFVPWSEPLAVGLGIGVATAATARGPVALPIALLAAGLGLAALAVRLPRRRGLVLVALLGFVLGGTRYLVWAAGADPAAALVGQSTVFEGRSDGRVLRLRRPLRATVVPVPRGAVPAGEVRVRGVLERELGTRNPGGFDYDGYLQRQGVAARLFVDAVVSLEPRVPLIDRFRRGARAGLPEQRAALMEAIALGVRDELGDLRDSFSDSGLAHVLSVSGLHLAVLVAALARLVARLGRLRYPLLMAATTAYVALVGPSPSVLRAACMVLAGLACLALGYQRIEPWPALALAACIGLLLSPASLFDASFQLSYLAVAGMLAFTAPLTRLLQDALPPPRRGTRRPSSGGGRRAGRGSSAGHRGVGAKGPPERRGVLRDAVAPALAVSVAAQLPTLSLLAGSFGAVPLASPLVNLAAVPIAGLLVPLGFLASALGLVSLRAATLLNQVVSPFAGALLGLSALGARLPRLPWGHVSGVGHVCFAAALLALALLANGRLSLRAASIVVLVAVCLSALLPPLHAPPEVVFLDVGQGDATLVRLPGRIEVLVDGGGTPFSDYDVGAEVVVPALRSLGVGRLEVVVATHPDTDHVEGLLSVLTSFDVGTLVIGHAAADSTLDAELRALAARRGVSVHEARRGERWRFGRGRSQAVFDVLNPTPRSQGSSNDDSVAFLLRYGGTPQVLFLGDLSGTVEAKLAVPHVPVLKVAHHGSAYSTTPALLHAARPSLAIVSVGRNGYGHPSPEALDRLRDAGATVLTTQTHGAVRLPLSARGPGGPSWYVR